MALRDARSIPDTPLAVAEEFLTSHVTYPTPEALVVFSSSTAELLIGFGRTYFTTQESVFAAVRSAFDSRAATLSSSGFGLAGYDYYERALDLWDLLGQDFFVDLDSARMRTERIPIESVTRLDDGWQITILGRLPGQRAVVTLSSNFETREARRLPLP